MNLEEMKVYAKELGIKSVHLYKREEKLQAKIDEKLAEVSDIVEVLSEDELPVVEENLPKEKEVTKIRRWEVISGKFYLGRKRYVAGETFESNDDYSKVFPIKEV